MPDLVLVLESSEVENAAFERAGFDKPILGSGLHFGLLLDSVMLLSRGLGCLVAHAWLKSFVNWSILSICSYRLKPT